MDKMPQGETRKSRERNKGIASGRKINKKEINTTLQ
jgi:hypothetical protein